MSDTISGALISAAGSILVAILSRGVETRTRSGQGPLSFVSSWASGARWWYVASAILLVWFALSPALVHHDFAGTNFFVIPLATIVLALLVPTLPLMGASITLGLFAANFLLGPLSNRIGGSQFDTQVIYDPRERSKQFTVLLIGFGAAAVASLICYLRLRLRGRVTQPAAPAIPAVASEPHVPLLPPQSAPSLARDIEKIARLHASHTLTDDEFQRAKEKLLGCL